MTIQQIEKHIDDHKSLVPKEHLTAEQKKLFNICDAWRKAGPAVKAAVSIFAFLSPKIAATLKELEAGLDGACAV